MRRLVCNYVAAALDRQKPDLERFIATHLEYPDAFPLGLGEPAVAIREIGRVRIAPQFGTDYPPIDVTAGLHVALTATAVRRKRERGVRPAAVPDAVLGRRTFAIDVEIEARGIAAGSVYALRLRRARPTAW